MAFKVRTKLTALYVSILAVSLIVFSVSFYYSLTKIYLDKSDREMHSIIGSLSHAIIKPPGELRVPKKFDFFLQKFFGLSVEGKYIQIMNVRGEVVSKSSNLKGFNLPISRRTFKNVRNGLTTYETIKTEDKMSFRMITRPVVMRDFGMVAIVQIATSLGDVEDVFRKFIQQIIIGVIISIIIAAIAGFFLARRALNPVKQITFVARKIGAENLDDRIELKGNPGDEFYQLSFTLNEMMDRLEKSFGRIKQFTADASHELKTPLTVLKGEMEVTLRMAKKGHVSSEDLKDVIESSLEEINRMDSIVKNLLDLTRFDMEVRTVKLEEINLRTLIEERYEQLKKVADMKEVGLKITHREDAIVMGDRVKLSQLISNLIENGLKYTPKEGRVEVFLAVFDKNAVIKIMDTGIGISEDHLEHLFDRFYRVDKARTRQVGGLGLGLSICKEIVEAHEGEIKVESKENAGTTFTVTLPLKGETVSSLLNSTN